MCKSHTKVTEVCSFDHTPNEVTKKALEHTKNKKGLKKAATIQELFDQLEN